MHVPLGEDDVPGFLHRLLTVQRQMIRILRRDDMGEQARTGQSFVDRLRRFRRDHDV